MACFGRRSVSCVSHGWLRELLLYEYLLLVLFYDLLVLLITRGHVLHQLVLYMHTMMMQHLVFRQQQLLKIRIHWLSH
jgi:hypothetical protein